MTAVVVGGIVSADPSAIAATVKLRLHDGDSSSFTESVTM
jgi:hypothetical protein